jgi:hypothetical protein
MMESLSMSCSAGTGIIVAVDGDAAVEVTNGFNDGDAQPSNGEKYQLAERTRTKPKTTSRSSFPEILGNILSLSSRWRSGSLICSGSGFCASLLMMGQILCRALRQ